MDKTTDLNTFLNTSPSNLDQFEQFLIQEGLKHQLEFIWAVQGLKSESLHLGQIIRTIYKHYFDVIRISDDVKTSVKSKISGRDYSLDIFDQAVDEVWEFLDSVVYKEFLKHVQSSEVDSSSASSSLPGAFATPAPTQTSSDPVPIPSDRGPNVPAHSSPPSLQYQPCSSTSVPKIPLTSLEPLIEGQELRNQGCSSNVVGLTRKALLSTQKSRSADQMPHSIAKQKPKFPYHFSNYNSYNPVSRQDSEVQSFSSGCLTDSDSIISETRKQRKHKREDLNRDYLPMQPGLQPTARCKKVEKDPRAFASLLTKKLQDLKRERELDEKLSKRLECEDLAQAIRDKLHLDETQPDDILDKHVSRVWSDVTPDSSRSPPGRREYKRAKAVASTALRPRVHFKDPDHQLPKSRTFPSTAKCDQDSGISITTNSTSDDFITVWLNNSKPSGKSNPVKSKKKEISSVVFYQDNEVPFCFKIPSTSVSLSLFKEYLPKKGNYRYFFKCRMDGLDGKVIMDEINRDEALIPIFDGKIVAHLRDF